MKNAFYHHIKKLCVQCQFSDDKERLVDAIIYGIRVHKAREKLLQMPKYLTLHDCLKIYHHYEYLSYHLNIVKPKKPVESITKRHFARGGKQQQQQLPAKRTGTFRGQPSTRPTNSSNKTVPCSYCGMTHPKDRCQAYRSTCFNCNRMGHFLSVCRSINNSSSSTQNSKQFNRFCGRGRVPRGRGAPRRQVNEVTEIAEAKSNDKYDLDIVRLIEAYGLSNNSPQTSLK